ncbi:MAG TPA: hypothetical protein VEC36_10350 [Patescibacteria group bacterium]|nr:hypothetical protein [Patescibacteria group bacterium]
MRLSDIDLRIVRTCDVLLHEETDPKRVERLESRLLESRILRNPPIVGEIKNSSESQYVVLDGATRSTSFKNVGYRDILVQVVEYPGEKISLGAWGHILPKCNKDIVGEICALKGLTAFKTDLHEAEKLLISREVVGFLLLPDNSAIVLKDGESLDEHVTLLKQIVKTYTGVGEIYRVIQQDLCKISSEHEFSAVMMFPWFTPDEIKDVALSGNLLPAGITRHIIPGRALHVNIPLEILKEEKSLKEKNEWLQKYLTEKVFKKEARHYEEGVFLFDE